MTRVDRTERLLNLVICLMATSNAVSRARIRADVYGYQDAASDTAFERMFERDKDELRSMGVPVETVVDVNGDVLGYRIDRADYRLSDAEWTLGERTALAMAARAWAQASDDLMGNLAAAKVESLGHSSIADVQGPSFVTASSAALLPLMRAIRQHQVVSFDYTGATHAHSEERCISPWGLSLSMGSWYVLGHDHHRAAMRTFRLSRIDSAVELSESQDYVHAPEDFDPASAMLPRDEQASQALVRVSKGRAASLRAAAVREEATSALDDTLLVEFRSREALIAGILGAGSDAYVVEPSDIVDAIRAALTELVRVHDVGESS